MPAILGNRSIGAALAAVIGGAMQLANAASALAIEQPTEAQILDALKAKRLTRCPHLSERSECGGAQLTQQPAENPALDVEIPFAYASASLGAMAKSTLAALGTELGKPGLKGAVFLIVGHTDAKGSAAYNQRLSVRRAETVRRVLMETLKVPADALTAVGYGKTQLKNTVDPFAGENRRVRIVNAEVK